MDISAVKRELEESNVTIKEQNEKIKQLRQAMKLLAQNDAPLSDSRTDGRIMEQFRKFIASHEKLIAVKTSVQALKSESLQAQKELKACEEALLLSKSPLVIADHDSKAASFRLASIKAEHAVSEYRGAKAGFKNMLRALKHELSKYDSTSLPNSHRDSHDGDHIASNLSLQPSENNECSHCAVLESRLQALQEQASSHDEDLQQADKVIAKLRAQLLEAQEQAEASFKKEESLLQKLDIQNQQISSLLAEASSLKLVHSDGCVASVGKAEEALETAWQQSRVLGEELVTKQVRLEQALAMIHQLETDRQNDRSIEEAIAPLNSQIAERDHQLARLTAEHANLTNRVTELDALLEQSQKTVDELTKGRSDDAASIDILKAEIEGHRKQIEEKGSMKQDTHSLLTQQAELVSNLNEHESSNAKLIEALQAEITKQQETINEMKRLREEDEDTIDFLQQQLDELSTSVPQKGASPVIPKGTRSPGGRASPSPHQLRVPPSPRSAPQSASSGCVSASGVGAVCALTPAVGVGSGSSDVAGPASGVASGRRVGGCTSVGAASAGGGVGGGVGLSARAAQGEEREKLEKDLAFLRDKNASLQLNLETLENRNARLTADLAALEAQHRSALAELEASHSTTLRELEASHSTTLHQLEASHSTTLHTTEARQSTELVNLQNRLSVVSEELAASNAALAEARAEADRLAACAAQAGEALQREADRVCGLEERLRLAEEAQAQAQKQQRALKDQEVRATREAESAQAALSGQAEETRRLEARVKDLVTQVATLEESLQQQRAATAAAEEQLASTTATAAAFAEKASVEVNEEQRRSAAASQLLEARLVDMAAQVAAHEKNQAEAQHAAGQEKLDRALASSAASVSRLKQENAELATRVATLSDSSNAVKKENAVLLTRVATLSDSLNAATKENAELVTRVATLSDSLDAAKKENAQVATLSASLNAVKQENVELVTRVATLNDSLDAAKKENVELVARVAALTDALGAARADTAHAAAVLTSVEKKNADLAAKIVILQDRVSHAPENDAALLEQVALTEAAEKRVAALQQSIRALEEKNSSLQASYLQQCSALTAVQGKLAQQQSGQTSSQQTVTALEERVRGLQRQIHQLDQQRMSALDEMEVQKLKFQHAMNASSEQAALNTQHVTRNQTLQQQLASLIADHEALLKAHSKCDAEKEELRVEADNARVIARDTRQMYLAARAGKTLDSDNEDVESTGSQDTSLVNMMASAAFDVEDATEASDDVFLDAEDADFFTARTTDVISANDDPGSPLLPVVQAADSTEMHAALTEARKECQIAQTQLNETRLVVNALSVLRTEHEGTIRDLSSQVSDLSELLRKTKHENQALVDGYQRQLENRSDEIQALESRLRSSHEHALRLSEAHQVELEAVRQTEVAYTEELRILEARCNRLQNQVAELQGVQTQCLLELKGVAHCVEQAHRLETADFLSVAHLPNASLLELVHKICLLVPYILTPDESETTKDQAAKHYGELTALRSQLSETENEIRSLRTELSSRPSRREVEELKNQLMASLIGNGSASGRTSRSGSESSLTSGMVSSNGGAEFPLRRLQREIEALHRRYAAKCKEHKMLEDRFNAYKVLDESLQQDASEKDEIIDDLRARLQSALSSTSS